MERTMIYDAYNDYIKVVNSGDKSSPEYYAAREHYEDRLRSRFGFGLNWEQAAIFAASLEFPSAHNVESMFC